MKDQRMRHRLLVLVVLQLAVSPGLVPRCCADDQQDLFTAENRDPKKLPTLGMWEEYSQRKKQTDRFVSAKFPNVADFACDLWCYESDGVTFKHGQPVDNGGVEMRHAWAGQDWEIVSTVTPLPGCLDFVARLERVNEHQTESPNEYPNLNICWQLRRAAGFASKPDPYPEFVKRCFIFTAKGRTFLTDNKCIYPNQRRPICGSNRANGPPTVQTDIHFR